MPFIHDDFLLTTRTAQRLYHEFAAHQPILDFHTHLPPADVAENRRFQNLAEIWLEEDHYKWRAMRANGVEERLITGDAAPFDKFMAWAGTVPRCLRNPLYHWTHLELKRCFGIDDLLDTRSAERIWAQTSEMLQSEEFSARAILKQFRVAAVCTTDDPADSLEHHHQIAQSGLATRILPTFRPDRALTVDQPEMFREWVQRLAATCGAPIDSFAELCSALKQRHADFHALGGRMSDHSVPFCYGLECDEAEAAAIFDQARAGKAADQQQHARFASYLMGLFGRWDAEKQWTKQLHLGARRNNNARFYAEVGPDAGFDSIGDWSQAAALQQYLDRLDRDRHLPKMILYNVNPSDNFVVATMAGNFQDGTVPGKIQFGSGWWFLDQKEGIEWQLNTLSNVGLLSRFVGMLTDSRSLLSYPRHEYFRRVLCNLLGQDVQRGELPDDEELLGPLVCDVCYRNARSFLDIDVAAEFDELSPAS